jgi:hypothetical protein
VDWTLGTQPRHQGRDVSLGRPVPLDPQEPQQPVPPQQVTPIAAARQRARVAEHEIPQVRDDRLQLPAVAVDDHKWQVGRLALDHRSHCRDRSPPFGQLSPHVLDHTTSFHQTRPPARSLILTWCSQQGAARTRPTQRCRARGISLGAGRCVDARCGLGLGGSPVRDRSPLATSDIATV